MQTHMYIVVGILGLMIGSFLNVCIYRIPRKESIAFPPSHCFSCNNNLKAIDLFPVLSYMFLRGKCRHCKAPISIQYPIVEALNSLIYLLLFSYMGATIHFLFYAVLASTLIVVSLIDYYHQIIPNKLVLICLGLGIIYKIVIISGGTGKLGMIKNTLLGFLIGGGVYLLIYVLSGGNMGGGDIKLMAALGLWLGWKYTLLAILLTFILGAIISVFLLATKIKTRKDAIPFGPFIVLGTLITIRYGGDIIHAYMTAMGIW